MPKNFLLTKSFWLFLLGIVVGATLQHNRDYISHSIHTLKSYVNYLQRPDMQWTMVNVNHSAGQGDAHVISFKDNEVILIDTGTELAAREKLLPFLKDNYVTAIDSVFISHAHKDHYAGLRVLLESDITIQSVYFNIPNKKVCDNEIPWGCDYDDILKLHKELKEKNIPIKIAKAGQTFPLAYNTNLHILYAFDGVNTPKGRTDINDMSLIMRLDYAGYRFLFTGDLNKRIGSYLAKKSVSIHADILKVPHHGTDGLAPNIFFEKVAANYALVPSPKQLWCSKRSERARSWFEQENIPVFVNGFSGHVQVTVKNKQLQIKTGYDDVDQLCK